jgi:hypothetical protein
MGEAGILEERRLQRHHPGIRHGKLAPASRTSPDAWTSHRGGRRRLRADDEIAVADSGFDQERQADTAVGALPFDDTCAGIGGELIARKNAPPLPATLLLREKCSAAASDAPSPGKTSRNCQRCSAASRNAPSPPATEHRQEKCSTVAGDASPPAARFHLHQRRFSSRKNAPPPPAMLCRQEKCHAALSDVPSPVGMLRLCQRRNIARRNAPPLRAALLLSWR